MLVLHPDRELKPRDTTPFNDLMSFKHSQSVQLPLRSLTRSGRYINTKMFSYEHSDYIIVISRLKGLMPILLTGRGAFVYLVANCSPIVATPACAGHTRICQDRGGFRTLGPRWATEPKSATLTTAPQQRPRWDVSPGVRTAVGHLHRHGPTSRVSLITCLMVRGFPIRVKWHRLRAAS